MISTGVDCGACHVFAKRSPLENASLTHHPSFLLWPAVKAWEDLCIKMNGQWHQGDAKDSVSNAVILNSYPLELHKFPARVCHCRPPEMMLMSLIFNATTWEANETKWSQVQSVPSNRFRKKLFDTLADNWLLGSSHPASTRTFWIEPAQGCTRSKHEAGGTLPKNDSMCGWAYKAAKSF